MINFTFRLAIERDTEQAIDRRRVGFNKRGWIIHVDPISPRHDPSENFTKCQLRGTYSWQNAIELRSRNAGDVAEAR